MSKRVDVAQRYITDRETPSSRDWVTVGTAAICGHFCEYEFEKCCYCSRRYNPACVDCTYRRSIEPCE